MADPFITPQDLVDYLGVGGTADPGMLIATDSACDICRTIAEQTFNRGTTTYVLDGTGNDSLLLPDLPVNSVGTVTVNGTAVTDYTLSSNGILYRGTVSASSSYARQWPGWMREWPQGRQNVTVTVDHGYAEVDLPRDVRIVALSIAARLVVQGVAAQETVGATQIRYGTNATDLTSGELRILKKYRPTR